MGLPRQTKRQELLRKFRALGWDGPVSGGKHPFMKKGQRKVHIPNPHHGNDIGVKLLGEILKHAGISADEWEQA